MHSKSIFIDIVLILIGMLLTAAAFSEDQTRPSEEQNRKETPDEKEHASQENDRDAGDAGEQEAEDVEESSEQKEDPKEDEATDIPNEEETPTEEKKEVSEAGDEGAVSAEKPRVDRSSATVSADTKRRAGFSAREQAKPIEPPEHPTETENASKKESFESPASTEPKHTAIGDENGSDKSEEENERDEEHDFEKEYLLEPVVVTAPKRSLSAQDEPAAKTELTETNIHDMDIKNIEDLSRNVPGLEFNDFGSRRHGIMFFRGIKTLPKGAPSVGYYVDGVNYSKSQMFGFPLFDVEYIEVVKGPQGTLYGGNTTGGVINIYTRQPNDEMAGSLGTTFGSYGRKAVRGNFSGPLIKEKVFFGFYGLLAAREGYEINDLHAEGDDGRHQDGKSGRVKITYLPAKAWEISMTLDLQHHDDGVYPLRRTERNALVQSGMFTVDDHYHYSHDFESSYKNDFGGGVLRLKNESDFGSFISLTGYRDYYTKEIIDADFSPLDRIRKHYIQKDKDITQEFRFSSRQEEKPLRWVVGTYFFFLDGNINETNVFGIDAGDQAGRRVYFDSRTQRLGPALFGQATYTFFKQLDLTAGLRFEYESAQYVASSLDTLSENEDAREKRTSFFGILPKLAASWHITDNHVTYGTMSLAHRSGGFNDLAAPADFVIYDQEYSWLNEIGLKSHFLDKNLLFKLAGFYTKIYKEQLPLMDVDSMQSYLQNAGRSHRLGVEVESRYRIIPGLDISVSFTWLEARFDEYLDPVANIDYKGNLVFGVPRYTYGTAINYRRLLLGDLALFGRTDLNGVGTRFFNDANTVKEDPYLLLNIKLGLEGENMEGYFWMQNITNVAFHPQ